MAVCADDHIAGAHKALLGQQGVFHAAVAALIIVGDVLFLRKLAGHHNLIGRINIFLRRKVVHDQSDLVFVKNLFRAHSLKRLDGKGAGNVVGKHQRHAALNNLAVLFHNFVCVGLQNFLRKRLWHGLLLSS